ncbi:hypothetical protein AKJ16_DCAP17908 [Drosera capensis]
MRGNKRHQQTLLVGGEKQAKIEWALNTHYTIQVTVTKKDKRKTTNTLHGDDDDDDDVGYSPSAFHIYIFHQPFFFLFSFSFSLYSASSPLSLGGSDSKPPLPAKRLDAGRGRSFPCRTLLYKRKQNLNWPVIAT